MDEVAHIGAVPAPCDWRNSPEAPVPFTTLMPLAPFPNNKRFDVGEVVPVPLWATPITVPFQTPVIIVPTDARFARVVIAATDVVEFSILYALRFAKLVLMVARESFSVSVPWIVVMSAPNFITEDVNSKTDTGA